MARRSSRTKTSRACVGLGGVTTVSARRILRPEARESVRSAALEAMEVLARVENIEEFLEGCAKHTRNSMRRLHACTRAVLNR